MRSPLPIDEHGVLSVEDLRAAGVDARHTAALVRSGELVSLTRGWYAARPPVDAEDRHRLVTEAHRRAYDGLAVPSHYSALLRLGLPLFRADLSVVHLTRWGSGAGTGTGTGSGQGRRRDGLVVHRRPAGYGGHLSRGGQVSPALAIVQTGMICGPMDALIAADAALHRDLVAPTELDEVLRMVKGAPRTHLLPGFLALADRRAESPGETRLRHAFHLMRLAVISQARVSDSGRTAFADFMLRDYPVLMEFDGLVKYADKDGRTGRANLVAEKGREDWLRGLGFEMERVIWSELDTPVVLARRARRAIERATGRSPRAWREAVRWAEARDAPQRT
ncbi:MAG TPA: type IV toxin-antitoxin system AbiEi family antitoxin domain-containing protein [Arachnia sp.]|nr:type IV toxin-antitoxin system AbiEi family antitoxin domain-containing protein [Arachnia sp.]